MIKFDYEYNKMFVINFRETNALFPRNWRESNGKQQLCWFRKLTEFNMIRTLLSTHDEKWVWSVVDTRNHDYVVWS